MDGGIIYDATSYAASTENAKVALNSLTDTKNSVSGVKSSIPSDFASAANVNSALGEIETVCDSKSTIDSAFNNWSSLLTVMDQQSLKNSSNAVSLGNGTYFINFDGNIMIYVTQGSESNSDGVGYPLDQYVMGVLDGEHEAINWGSKCYHGEITKAQYLNALKAFAIMARSYGLAQTVYSKRHSEDHKIQNGATKQCFNTRLFANNGEYKAWDLMSSTASAASLETTGMVLAKDGVPTSAYYVSSKTQKILEYSVAGYSYIDIIKKLYSDGMKDGMSLQYYDYSTKTLLGEVPSDTKVSKLIGKNLGTSNTVGLSYTPSNDNIVTTITADVGQTTTNGTVNTPVTIGTGSNAATIVATGAAASSVVVAATGNSSTTNGYTSSSSIGTSNSGHTSTTVSSVSYPSSSSSSVSSQSSGSSFSSNNNRPTSSSSSSSSSSSGNSNSVSNTSSSSSGVATTSNIINILPDTKFSDAIPALNTGNLGSMEIGESFIKYEIKDLNDINYAVYINKLQNSGYILSADGTNWSNGKYLINFERNPASNITYISLSLNSSVTQI